MTGFSPEWLALREAADARARNRDVAEALAARFALRETLSVVDLGSGTGANLRATAPLLPARQAWTLTDHDAGLLSTARTRLIAWADTNTSEGDVLHLTKGHAHIAVSFKICDLARDLDNVIAEGTGLVTASAFFDLVSESYIRRLAKAVAQQRAGFYAVLTYNGVQRWSPHRPADNQMASAFHRHMLRDKGFGVAAGPLAPAHLADQFRLNGYTVLEGDSPWRLERGDRMLIEELIRGHAFAVAETGIVDMKTIEAWVKVARNCADVGHIDTFAMPT